MACSASSTEQCAGVAVFEIAPQLCARLCARLEALGEWVSVVHPTAEALATASPYHVPADHDSVWVRQCVLVAPPALPALLVLTSLRGCISWHAVAALSCDVDSCSSAALLQRVAPSLYLVLPTLPWWVRLSTPCHT